MRLSVKNSGLIDQAKSFVNTDSKRGPIIKITSLLLASIIGFGFGGCQNKNINKNQTDYGVASTESSDYGDIPMREQYSLSPDEIINEPAQDEPIVVSLDEINAMNIIINDSDCMDDFINSVCEQLDSDGLRFSYTKECKNINTDDAVVITLDQQYMAGPNTAIFAPLQEGRNGNSDALTLATERAFYQNGFLVNGIACGQMGFRENADGTVSERVPTPTEEAIDEDTDASFVTVSFGTTNNNAQLVAKAIEGSLIRYYSYMKNNQADADLIYCIKPGEDISIVQNHFGAPAVDIDMNEFSNMDAASLPGKTIINPSVKGIKEFDRYTPTSLVTENLVGSKRY